MTEQEIKERIRREYPPGTKFYPVDTVGKLDKERVYTVMKSWRLIASCDKAYFINSASNYSHKEYIYYEGHWAHILQQEQQPAPKLIPVTKYVKGLRVQRGPDWKYSEQDGGAGNFGTIISNFDDCGRCRVRWNNGYEDNYMIGCYGKYDLVALANPADAHLLEENPLSEFHNPDKLTPEQVGEGYRLLYSSEILVREKAYLSIEAWVSTMWHRQQFHYGSIGCITYRVPACFPKDFTEQYIRDYEAGLLSKPEPETVNMEEILQEAKRRYPEGTKYSCATGDGDQYVVTEQNFSIPSDSPDKIYGEPGKGCLYKHGKWARIISKPKVKSHPVTVDKARLSKEQMIAKLTEMYPVGTVFRPASIANNTYNPVTVKEDWKIRRTSDGYDFTDGRTFITHSGYVYTDEGVYAEIVSTPEAPAETYNGFLAGKVYKWKTDEDTLAYFCGISKLRGLPVFELIQPRGSHFYDNVPKNWTSKASNTYWGYRGLETTFDPTPVEYPTTNTHNTVQAKPSGLVLENPTIIISTQNEKVTSRGSISFEQRSSREGIFLPGVNLEIRKGDPVRGTGFKSTAVEVSIGDRHRNK